VIIEKEKETDSSAEYIENAIDDIAKYTEKSKNSPSPNQSLTKCFSETDVNFYDSIKGSVLNSSYQSPGKSIRSITKADFAKKDTPTLYAENSS
jgi:hypothetical protein